MPKILKTGFQSIRNSIEDLKKMIECEGSGSAKPVVGRGPSPPGAAMNENAKVSGGFASHASVHCPAWLVQTCDLPQPVGRARKTKIEENTSGSDSHWESVSDLERAKQDQKNYDQKMKQREHADKWQVVRKKKLTKRERQARAKELTGL